MEVYPAIDLLGGQAVRLRQGRREQATVYSAFPEEVARAFLDAGARRLHVVDLDGAFSGRRENLDAVERILTTGAKVQLGGGVRDLPTCRRLLDAGVDRVVVGTLAVRQPQVIRDAEPALRAHLVVAVDARDGRVRVEGWEVDSGLDALAVASAAAEAGVAAILYTDIARDGTSRGPNVAATARLAQSLRPLEVIASGGIARLEDLEALQRAGVPAAVVGRALYEETFTLAEALAAAAGR